MDSVKRLIPFELNKITYWLNYSVGAARQIDRLAKDYGYPSSVEFLNETDAELELSNTLQAAEIMIDQGAKYRAREGYQNVSVVSAGVLETLLTINDYDRLGNAVAEAIVAGSVREVEATPPPKKEKAKVDEEK